MNDITDAIDKVEIDFGGDEEVATVVLTNANGTITIVGKATVVEVEAGDTPTGGAATPGRSGTGPGEGR